MAKSSVAEIYQQFYEQFVQILPMCNAEFVEALSEHGLLPEITKAAVQSVPIEVDKALLFLNDVIKPGIMVGNDKNFNMLLVVMENSEFVDVKVLASQIRNEMKMPTGLSYRI